ncbi:trypsin-like peptidase domain-containing protein [Streptosporangium sandarakinum]|uniref:Putative serine protease PepD n=1 Tax=Streptosporangium sandarakinum TaxID=1260955 RepID=A0A852UTH2_9ACTN|nr:trypsin-like peptidase domain-containing protein [Streptosporangium sandarakinum]NYF38404.1 putative serine protease PepD [Streptosporangium sandarakinum]
MEPNKDGQDTTPADATGWSQFGKVPPRAGGFAASRPADPQPTLIHPVPEALTAPAPGAVPAQRTRLTAAQKIGAGLALAVAAVGGGVVGSVATASFGDGPATAPAAVSAPLAAPAGNVTTVADVAAAVQPSVVSIQVKAAGGSGEGSGVVLTADGMILTNNHVVEAGGQGGEVTVKFSDGKTATARIVGTDPATDLAVIKANDVSGLTAASLGDSDKLKVGDSVLAVGSPLGLSGSVTAGIVSALDRTVTVGGQQQQPQLPPGWGGGWGGGQQQRAESGPTTIGHAIQTDAAINPGNSGGALVDTRGQLVGINSAIATNGGDGNIGVGFAIPINTAKQVADQLIKSGKVSHAFLGVNLAQATGDTTGALVAQVTADSPAQKAGIKQGDVITKIGGTAVDGPDTVVGAVRGLKPGQEVSLTYLRDGREQNVRVTLEEKTTTS